MRSSLAATAVGTFLTLLVPAGYAQAVAPLSEIKVTVVDQTGARIPGSELAFKGDSKTIVSHTGSDGAVTVTLPSGQYTVSVSARGFLKNNLSGLR
jgi:hypothetical protein